MKGSNRKHKNTKLKLYAQWSDVYHLPSNTREITETSQVCTFYLRHAWNTDQNTPLEEGVMIVLYYNEGFLCYINSCRRHYTIISLDYQMRRPSGKT